MLPISRLLERVVLGILSCFFRRWRLEESRRIELVTTSDRWHARAISTDDPAIVYYSEITNIAALSYQTKIPFEFIYEMSATIVEEWLAILEGKQQYEQRMIDEAKRK